MPTHVIVVCYHLVFWLQAKVKWQISRSEPSLMLGEGHYKPHVGRCFTPATETNKLKLVAVN